MSDNRINIVLFNPQQGYQQLLTAWQWAKAMLTAGHRLVLSIRKENRTDLQNNLLHSRISDVSKHCVWASEKLDIEDWKRLLTAGWCRANAQGVRIIPAIDGQGFDVLYRRTSKLTRSECVDLSDYIMAWGDSKAVPWCAASLGRHGVHIDQETGEILETA